MSDLTPTKIPEHPPVNDAGDGQVISETNVKQGRKGYTVLAVLVVSTILAVIVMFGIWGMHAGKMSTAAGAAKDSKAAAAATYNAPPPEPKESANPQTAPTATANQ
jgi:quinol-cytochrome oxidoreductase complex cytochrome b subunit